MGFESEVAEKCSIKRTVIGRHCNVAARVKLTNSVLMDNVQVCEEYMMFLCRARDLQKQGPSIR